MVSDMLSLVPVSLREANEFVRQHHRHHKPTVGHKFSIGVREDGRLAGVAICGRPVSRFLDDGYTLEVNRLCTDGARNACSMLYGAAVRAAKAMGYHKIITYILDSECGVSLKASGFMCEGPAMPEALSFRRRTRKPLASCARGLPGAWSGRAGASPGTTGSIPAR
jgi:hypothetical protein